MTKPLSLRATVHSPEGRPGDPVAYAGDDSFTFVRVQLRSEDGQTGNGFTGRFLASEVAHFLNGALAEAVTDTGPDQISALAARFNPRGMTGVVVSALSALEIALTDLEARRAGIPVARLCGGARASAPVHVTCGFAALDTDALVETCAREVAEGARGVKVLVAGKGRDLQEDAARLKAVRDAIGPGADLIADANCRMDLDTALAFARSVADLDLAWLEEPVTANDRRALAKLSAEGIVPLGAGQMEQSADRFALLAEAGVGVLQPNAVFAGGLRRALDIARTAMAAGCRVSPGGGWDVVNLHWVCGGLSEAPVELHRAQSRIVRMLCPDGLRIAGGDLHLPDAPGFGFAPDEVALTACQIDMR